MTSNGIGTVWFYGTEIDICGMPGRSNESLLCRVFCFFGPRAEIEECEHRFGPGQDDGKVYLFSLSFSFACVLRVPRTGFEGLLQKRSKAYLFKEVLPVLLSCLKTPAAVQWAFIMGVMHACLRVFLKSCLVCLIISVPPRGCPIDDACMYACLH